MKATVYYVNLTKENVAEINEPGGAGWATRAGSLYLRAKEGNIDEETRPLFVKAATTEVPEGTPMAQNELVWSRLQNLAASWTEGGHSECFTDSPRSMDVGDLIVWDNGETFRCDNCGWAEVDNFAE